MMQRILELVWPVAVQYQIVASFHQRVIHIFKSPLTSVHSFICVCALELLTAHRQKAILQVSSVVKDLEKQKENNMDVKTAKIICMVLLGGISLILGYLPVKIGAYFQRDDRGWKRTVTSVLLCFGGGVLFATSMIHMLPEVSILLGIEII